MRLRVPSLKTLGRGAALAFVAAAIIAAAVSFKREPATHRVVSPPNSRVDPLAPALARCQALGMAAEQDAACEATWAENRRRFFNDQTAPEAR